MKDIRIDLYETPTDPYVRPSKLVADLGIKYEKWDPNPAADSIWLRNVDLSTVPAQLPVYMTLRDVDAAEWNRRVEQRKIEKQQRKHLESMRRKIMKLD